MDKAKGGSSEGEMETTVLEQQLKIKIIKVGK